MVRVQSSALAVQAADRVDSFKDLIAWQKSVLLVKAVYGAVKAFPKDELFALTSQIKRCSVSVASNIAEGSAKGSTKEFIRFLTISYGSLAELETQIIIACELGFLPSSDANRLNGQCNEVGKIINGLIRSLDAKLNSEL